MNRKTVILVAGISLLSIFGWSQIPPTQTNQSINGYRNPTKAVIVYQTIRQGGSSSYSSSSGYSSSSSSSSSSSYSSGGSSYGK